MKATFCIVIFALIATCMRAQTNLTELLQQGMFEEQADHNINAAIADYEALSTQFDKDRQLAATAIFRLGECYREEGQTNQAAAEYHRILNEFPDQKTLVTLSQEDLAGMGAAPSAAGQAGNTSGDIWVKVRALRKPELEKVLPTLVPDAILTSLLQQRNTAETALAQKRTYMSENNPEVTAQKAALDAISLQIAQRISGIMEALKLQYEATPPVATGGSGGSANDEDQDLQRIQEMVQNSPDLINVPSNGPYTPLQAAAAMGHLRVAGYLLDHGADVNQPGPFKGDTALVVAANAAQKAMVELLLTHGADFNAKGRFGQTALYAAANRGFEAVVEALLAAHADVNEADDIGETPLFPAAANGNAAIVQMLLAAGANPNAKAAGDDTILSSAARVSPDIVKMLLAAGADPNAKTSDGYTALSRAASRSPDSVKLLLSAGADPNTTDKNGRTALSYAAQDNAQETLKMLLDSKADPNAGTSDAPLLCAINNNDTTSGDLLLQAGANPNLKGFAPDLRGTSYNRATPLWMAVWLGQLPMVQLLLKYKADPNDSRIDNTPVIFIALDKTNILQALLNAGADPNALNNQGILPIDSAIGDDNPATLALLLKYGANPNARDPHGDIALFEAAYSLDERILRLLLDYGANPNVTRGDDQTPLQVLEAGWNGLSSDQKTTAAELADLLRRHGALETLPDWDHITISRPSTKYSNTIFHKETSDWNHFTLYDLLGVQYNLLNPAVRQNWSRDFWIYNQGPVNNDLPFPDFSRIVIHRPPENGTNWTDLKVDLTHALDSGDCGADVPLKFGDVVEIPEMDHVLNAQWTGLTTNQIFTLAHCLARRVQITVNGMTTNVTLGPQVKLTPNPFRRFNSFSDETPMHSSSPMNINLTTQTFMLWPVLDNSGLLLSSSDLAHVTVKRRDAATGEDHEWTLDCSNPDAAYLWLRDGDVIDVPEASDR